MSQDTNAPAVWSWALMALGFAILAACEVASGVYAFETANRTIMLGDAPVDALMKIAGSALPAFAAFGGAWFYGWLRARGSQEATKQARIALIATLIAFTMATWQFASYLGWARRMAEYPVIAKTVEYEQAVKSYADATALLSGGLGYEQEDTVMTQQEKAAKIVKSGQAPKGSELPDFQDLLKALAMQGLPMLMGAAFQLPAGFARAKQQRKGPKKGGKPKLVASNG